MRVERRATQYHGRRDGTPFRSRSQSWVQTMANVDGSQLNFTKFLDAGATHIYLAAFHLNDPAGNIHLNDAPPEDSRYDYVWPQIKYIQEKGIKVLILLGGAAQGSYQRLDRDFESYYPPLKAMIERYHFDGIDLDIEEEVDISCPLRLLNQLYIDFGPRFLLTMAPVASAMFLKQYAVGLSGFDYHDLDSQATAYDKPDRKLVDWYNCQFYNGWGDASSTDWYDYIVNVGAWDPTRIVMGVLDNPRDGGSGFVPLTTLKETIHSLQSTYNNRMGGVIGWEYFNAGISQEDGLQEPWQWVRAISDALYANYPPVPGPLPSPSPTPTPSPSPSPIADLPRIDPDPESLPQPTSEWQGLLNKLLGLGANRFEAVRALNTTDGNPRESFSILHIPLALLDSLDSIIGGL
ncbi:hypothetical protein Dda_8600 [Drechslerella dactyloides]|uniref:chitinase n=1 Tax=Drechslerella dactyloides TaxID=74499 RepID=A0AAD6NHF6_DREDA|nr:hypothetical protein Dda_8600 [Drechslerella dactyloides]